MSKSRIGFIGAGYMGYGLAKNLLKQHEVYIIAHKNRDPIDRLVNQGFLDIDMIQPKETRKTSLENGMSLIKENTEKFKKEEIIF